MSISISNFSISLDELKAKETPSTSEGKGFRSVCLKSGVFGKTRGSAYAEFGNTKVLAQINGPKEDGKGDFHNGVVTVVLKGSEEKIRAQLESALSGCIQLHKYAKSEIEVEISVLSDDGGLLQVALIVASMALVHAGIELLDICVAANVAVKSGTDFVVDPTTEVTSSTGTVTVGLLPNLNQIVCCDMKGALNPRLIGDVTEFAISQAIRLVPVIRNAIIQGIS